MFEGVVGSVKRRAKGLADEEVGYADHKNKDEGIGQYIENVFATKVEAGDEEVEVGVEGAEYDRIGDEVALGGGIGQIGAEAQGLRREEQG